MGRRSSLRSPPQSHRGLRTMTQQSNTNNPRRFQVRHKSDYVEASRLETFIPRSLEEMQAEWRARQARYRLAVWRPPLPPPPPEPPSIPTTPDPVPGSPPHVDAIQKAVCAHYCIRMIDLLSDHREQRLVLARHLAIYLARNLTYNSLFVLGRLFRRDHTTILHAITHIKHQMQHDRQLEASVMMLTERLGP